MQFVAENNKNEVRVLSRCNVTIVNDDANGLPWRLHAVACNGILDSYNHKIVLK